MWVQLVSNVLLASHCSSDNCWEACAYLLQKRANVACPWYLQMLSLGREVANSRSAGVSTSSVTAPRIFAKQKIWASW